MGTLVLFLILKKNFQLFITEYDVSPGCLYMVFIIYQGMLLLYSVEDFYHEEIYFIKCFFVVWLDLLC